MNKRADQPQGGLCNLGNTCYINATIACLYFCPKFNLFICQKSWIDNTDKLLINDFFELINDLWKNKQNLIPKKFINKLKLHIKQIVIFEPNDIHEFINLFINKIHQEIAIPLTLQDKEIILNDKNIDYLQPLINNLNMNWFNNHKNEWSPFIDMFFGQSITQILCGFCNKIHHNYEVFDNIMLSIPNISNNTNINLDDCFDAYFEKEILNEWICDKCKTKTPSKKSIKLYKIPDILIITIKRFNHNLEKNHTEIHVPVKLSLNKWTIKNKSSYKLVSVAYHSGNFSNGHYYCIGCENNTWWKVDDLSCDVIKNPELSKGYVYFYVKL